MGIIYVCLIIFVVRAPTVIMIKSEMFWSEKSFDVHIYKRGYKVNDGNNFISNNEKQNAIHKQTQWSGNELISGIKLRVFYSRAR